MANPVGCTPARTRTVRIFIAEETVSGTPVDPVTGDYIPLVADPTLPIPLGRADLEDMSRGPGLSEQPSVQGQSTAQTLDIKTYLYHSESAGVIPLLSKLYEGMYGVETINGGSDVQYSPSSSDLPLKSYTVLVKTDNLSMMFSAQINSGVPNVNPSDSPDAVVQVDWSLNIFSWHFYVSGSASGTSAVGVVTFSDNADAARFQVGSYVDIDGAGTKVTVDAVDRTAGTIDVSPAPGDGPVVITPWAPVVPALSDLDNRCLAHKAELLISTTTGETPFIIPTKNMTPSFINNLLTVFDETGRAIGEGCTYRTEKRSTMIVTSVKAYDEFAELDSASAEDREITAVLSIPGALDATRSVKFQKGTNGSARLRITGSPSSENGILTYPVEIKLVDPTGGDDAMIMVFD